MHEQSLVRALLEQASDVCRQHGATAVTEIRVEVGPLSGVEPLLLTSAFEQLAPVSAALVIDQVALSARCLVCHHEFEISDFVFRCPTCDGNVKIIRGDNIQLVSVSLRADEPAEEGVL